MLTIRELPRYEALEARSRKYPTLDPTTVLAFLSVVVVAGDIDRGTDAYFAKYGLSHGRFFVLILLDRKGGSATPAELATEAGVTRATMTGLLDGLEKDGHVERTHRTDDRRSVDVKVTRKGQSLLEKTLPDHYARINAMMAPLSKTERKQLVALLAKAREGIAAQAAQDAKTR